MRSIYLILLLSIQALFAQDSTNCPLAFPEAEGFGACAKGGTGGKVLTVTTLEDSDSPGTFRWATEIMKGPRIVKFNVEGIISLKKNIKISWPFLTIDGSSAPGKGITLKDGTIRISTNDVIVRYIRVRPGDEAVLKKGIWTNTSRSDKPMDAITIKDAINVIIDHVSASWTADEVISVTESKNVTVQWSILTEPLSNKALHIENGQEISHAYGSLMNGENISYIKNLFSNFKIRGPQMCADIEGDSRLAKSSLLTANNIVAFYSDSGTRLKLYDKQIVNYVLVNNFYQDPLDASAPAIHSLYSTNPPVNKRSKFYIDGNILPDGSMQNIKTWNGVDFSEVSAKDLKSIKATTLPFPYPRVNMILPKELKQKILPTLGASLPVRDVIDTRVINQLENHQGEIIFSQDSVGGYSI